MGGGGGGWLRPILVFSLSLDQAEQKYRIVTYTTAVCDNLLKGNFPTKNNILSFLEHLHFLCSGPSMTHQEPPLLCMISL